MPKPPSPPQQLNNLRVGWVDRYVSFKQCDPNPGVKVFVYIITITPNNTYIYKPTESTQNQNQNKEPSEPKPKYVEYTLGPGLPF